MKAQFVFFFSLLFFTVTGHKISGDAGIEAQIMSDLVTVDPNPFNIPTINWDDIIKNIPTIPPLVLPTLDPNFWQNLPTIPPIAFPTIDPDFWKNFPTLPPIQIPTLDPNFWQNLNFPTLPPLQFPTLDPNFWQNLPTLPPFPTLSPFIFPTPTPKSSQCTYKLAQEIQNNQTFATSLNYTNPQSVVDFLMVKSVEICTGFQTQRLTEMSKKYAVLIVDIQEIVPYLSTSDLKQILLSILQADSGRIFQIFFSKTMENLANPTVTSKISKASSQISMLQFDLALNPI